MEMCPFIQKHKYIVFAVIVLLLFVLFFTKPEEKFAYSPAVSDIRIPLRGFLTSLRSRDSPQGWKDMLDDLQRYKSRTLELLPTLKDEPKQVVSLIQQIVDSQQTILSLLQSYISCEAEGCDWKSGVNENERTKIVSEQKFVMVALLDELQNIAS